MSVQVAPVAGREETDREVRPRRRWPTWAVVLLSGTAGLALGVVLAIITVILPRTRELARLAEGSPFLREVDPAALLKSLGPRVLSVTSNEDRDFYTNHLAGRTMEARLKIPFAEQDAFLQNFNGLFQREAVNRHGQAYSTGVSGSSTTTASGDGAGTSTREQHNMVRYTVAGSSGMVHFIVSARGDDYHLIVIVAEH
jgi:hypothetical protein